MIMFASPGVAMSDPSRVAREHLTTILGGSFTSRLNQNLREKNGYTYGARSSFTMAPTQGWFTATAAVQTKVTGPALNEFMSEFARIRSGDISADEAQKAARSIRQDVVGDFETLSGVLGQAADRVASNLPFATIAQDLSATITADGLNTLAKSAITTDQGVLVLVGDKAAILDQLKAIPRLKAPTQVDAYGNEIK
jgi:predicted Zn-dependent peptidase